MRADKLGTRGAGDVTDALLAAHVELHAANKARRDLEATVEGLGLQIAELESRVEALAASLRQKEAEVKILRAGMPDPVEIAARTHPRLRAA